MDMTIACLVGGLINNWLSLDDVDSVHSMGSTACEILEITCVGVQSIKYLARKKFSSKIFLGLRKRRH